VKAVVFDVGETLVDETRGWERAADAVGVPRFTLMGVLGGLAARGEPHTEVWRILGLDEPPVTVAPGHSELYDDALPALRTLRTAGLRVGAAGNMPAAFEELLRPHVDAIGSSQRWGVNKPEPAFFARIAEELDTPAEEIAYVGDRVDNDVLPAREAGMMAIHIRRGPWAHLHETPEGVPSVRSLDEVLELVRG
jgi:HAD superfamily hydrolase (TIGR01509 family)